MQQNILSLVVRNRFGALTKITSMFGRRGCNINSLTVSPMRNAEVSAITVTVYEERERVEQICSQLGKLEDVLTVDLLEGDNFTERSFALIDISNRQTAERIAAIPNLNSVTTEKENGTFTMEIIGPTEEIRKLTEALTVDEVTKIICSGCIALKHNN